MSKAKFNHNILKPSKRTLSSLAAIPLATAAHGAITPVNVTLGNVDELFLDFDSGTYSTVQQGVSDASFSFQNQYPEKPITVANNGWDVASYYPSNGPQVQFFDIGDTTNNTNVSVYGFIGSPYGQGPFSGSSFEKKGIGFTNDTDAAYVLLSYDDDANTMTIHHFDTAEGQTTIQVVPEPATSAALMALLAGGAMVFQRSRKRANI